MSSKTEGLTRFVESFSSDNRNLIKADLSELKESLAKIPAKLKESVNTDSTEGWWVPISHYGNYKNGNGRIYNTKLWKNVINNQRETYFGAPMLCDHPSGDSDGNPKDICGVWLDAKLGPEGRDGIGIVYGLLIPSGRAGEDLADFLKKGGKIGTSSSGFGKLMSDGVTVDPDTYIIERLADWVLNPSQGTFFAYDEDEDDIKDKSLTESTSLNEGYIGNIRDTAERYIRCHDNPSSEEVVDYVKNIFSEVSRETIERLVKDYKLDEKTNSIYLNNTKESVVKDSKLAKLEEKKFRRDMESFLESANNIKDPQERLEEFREIRSYLEDGACPDLREKIEAKIVEEEAEIKRILAESIEMRDELGIKDSKDLKEKLTKISEDVKVLEEESTNWKGISEKLQTKYNEAQEQLKARPTDKYVEYLKGKNEKLNLTLKERNEKTISIVKNLTESYKKMRSEKEDLEKKIENLEIEKNSLTESIKKAETYKKLSEKANNVNYNSYIDLENKLKEATATIEKYAALVEEQRTLIESVSIENAKLKKLSEKKNEMAKRFSEDNKRSREALLKVREELRENRRMESGNVLDEYFEELVESYGDEMYKYERKIREARNLTEAKNIFYRQILQNLKESREIDDMRIPESLYTTPEDRRQYIDPKRIQKSNAVDRLPKGWV